MSVTRRISTITITTALMLTSLITACHTAMSGPSAATHSHAQAADRAAVHGMLVVGTNAIYVSHLPMFHAPHAYQALAEVTLQDARGDALARYVADKTQSHSDLYTLVPAPGVLTAMMQPGGHFAAELYRGHFERGGTPILTGLTATVRRVIHFRPFTAGETPRIPKYLLFGTAKETFAAHWISAAPDFDQVVAVTGSPLTDAALANGLPITLGSKGPMVAGTKLGAKSVTGTVSLTVGQGGYIETGDLSE
ncbi:MAG: hypothetical protein H7338_17830 [Candidatus Sericytochromatia bacterium]|nr:hypothetical protein [Candidatus Sericytochromatia bacterium]